MGKGILAIIMATAIVSSASVIVFADNTQTSGLYTYEIKGNGTLTITDYDWENNEGDVYIPTMLDGYNVTAIEENAFSVESEDNLSFFVNDPVSVTIPPSISMIGNYAFKKANVSVINIPSSIKNIGTGAFYNCLNLTQFIVDPENSVYASIDGALYEKSSKKLLSWPQGKVLTEKAIPKGILEIGDYALSNVDTDGVYSSDKLLPSTIIKIDEGAFMGSYISFEKPLEAITDIPDYAFMNVNTITLPSNTVAIGDYGMASETFDWDDYNRDFIYKDKQNIPSTIETIGNYAFYNRRIHDDFKQSSKMVLQDGLKSIGDYAFAVDNDGSECKTKKLLYDIETVSFPSSIQSVGRGAFSNRIVLEKVKFANGYEGNISNDMFLNCKKLSDVTLPDNLISIGDNAFSGCDELSELEIPASVSKIGNDAFEKNYITLIVEKNSYAELWAQENGISYKYRGQDTVDNLDWLNDDANSNPVSEDTSWIND